MSIFKKTLKGNNRTFKKRTNKPYGIKLKEKNKEVAFINNLSKFEHGHRPKFRHKAFAKAYVDQHKGKSRFTRAEITRLLDKIRRRMN